MYISNTVTPTEGANGFRNLSNKFKKQVLLLIFIHLLGILMSPLEVELVVNGGGTTKRILTFYFPVRPFYASQEWTYCTGLGLIWPMPKQAL